MGRSLEPPKNLHILFLTYSSHLSLLHKNTLAILFQAQTDQAGSASQTKVLCNLWDVHIWDIWDVHIKCGECEAVV